MTDYRQDKNGNLSLDVAIGQPNPVGMKKVELPGIYHADNVKGHENNPGLKAVSVWLGEVQADLGYLNEVRTMPNPLNTDAANKVEYSALVERSRKGLGSQYDRANKSLSDEATKVQNEINKTTKLNETTKYENHYLTLFLNAKPNERQNMLAKALAESDVPLLSAVLNAPTSLTGLSRELVDAHRDAFEAKVAPDLVKARDELRAGAKVLDQGMISFHSTFDRMLAGTQTDLSGIQKLEEVKSKLRNEKPSNTPNLQPPVDPSAPLGRDENGLLII